MLQGLSNFWPLDSKGSPVLAVCAAIFLVLVIVYIIYRSTFANRLRLPGAGRARQPRLGLVDAFPLDGQRQLVLVRRDNVEHLVMIGGPNDLLVESQIVRIAAPATNAHQREREAGSAKAAPVLAPVTASSAGKLEGVVAEPMSPRAAKLVEEPILEPASANPEPPRRRIELTAVRVAAPSRVETSAAASTEAAPAATTKPTPAPPPQVAATPSVVAMSMAPARTPTPGRPLTTPLARAPLPQPIGGMPRPRTSVLPAPIEPALVATAARPAPNIKPEPVEASLELVSSSANKPAPPVPSQGKPAETFADLESLEAEMARLLGRDS